MKNNHFSESRNTSGIARQLLRVFVLQMLFISAITVLGVYAAAKVVEGTMMRAALEGEASHFWFLLENNPSQPLPNTDNLRGYLARQGDMSTIPMALRDMQQGYGRVVIQQKRPLVYVQEKEKDRLYLVFDEESVSRLSFYFGVVPLSLALIILYISAWFAYQQSRKAVSPLVQLAKTMRQFNIESQNFDDLNLKEMGTRPGNYEVGVLIEALNGFTDEIRQLIARERRFTRDASHELRTPLTVIQGSAEWLDANLKMDTVQSETLKRILRTVGDMNELVNALLLLARGSKQGTRTQQVELVSMVEALIDDLMLTHNSDDRITTNIIVDRPVTLNCSSEGLYMVISNLLRNAFNYTDEGEVQVRIKENGIEISNQVKGMKQIDIDELFKPFVRGDAASSIQGYGVGLDIVKRLCDHFYWSIDAQYSSDKGMTFGVDFKSQN